MTERDRHELLMQAHERRGEEIAALQRALAELLQRLRELNRPK